jgi:hypothetical protein
MDTAPVAKQISTFSLDQYGLQSYIRPCRASRSLRALMDCAKNVLISVSRYDAHGCVQVCVPAVRPV